MADGILQMRAQHWQSYSTRQRAGAGMAAFPPRRAVLPVDWLLLSHFGEFFFQGLDFGHLALGFQFFQPGKVHVFEIGLVRPNCLDAL